MVGSIISRTPNYGFAIIRFDSVGWHSNEHDNWRSIDALLSSVGNIPSVRGIWQNSIAYNIGDRVTDTDTSTVWRCIVSHTSAAMGTFADDRTTHPGYWQVLTLTPVFTGAWSTGVTYNTLDEVVYDNAYYICVATHLSTDFIADEAVDRWVLMFDLQPTLDAQAAAEAAALAAATSETNAGNSATAAAGSASTANTAATNAGNSATAAAGSATTAGTAATNAANSASAANTSAGNAAASELNAAGSASAAATSANNAAVSEANAAASAATVNPSNFYTKVAADARFAPIVHTHVAANITDFATAVGARIAATKFRSSPIAVVAGGSFSVSHGLGAKPSQVCIWLRAKNANNGYSVGDEFLIAGGQTDGAGTRGVAPVRTSTVVSGIFSANAGVVFFGPHKTTGAFFNAAIADWEMVLDVSL